MANQVNVRRMAGSLLLVVSVFFITVMVVSGSISNDTPANGRLEVRSAPVDDFWSRIVSPETARVMRSDRQLQRNFLDAVELTADLTKRLADQFETVPELQQASDHIEAYRRSLQRTEGSRPTRRQSLSSLGGLFGGMTGGAGATPGGGATNSSDGGIFSGLTSGISSAFSGIGDSLLKTAGGSAMFLGTGLGAGAAQGLNLAPADKTTQVAAKVIADNGQNATGLNPAIQNAAMGATASLLGSVNVSSLAASAGNIDIKGAAYGLATGIGNGTSAGLKLSPQAEALAVPPGNSTADIAGTFGFGLTKTLTSNIDLQKMTSGFSLDQLKPLTGGQPVSMIALGLANGIGDGASSGLKLTQANLAPPAGDTAADTVGAFGFGLTNSVTRNINVSSLTSNLQGNSMFKNALAQVPLAQTASSFGTGLGSGAASGLKLSSAIIGAPDPMGSDIPNVAGNFAFGLTKSVAENVNGSMLMNSGGGMLQGLTKNINFGRVAQGAAMGFVQGAGDAVNSMGGLQALINGTAVMPTTPLPVNNMAFNDTVGGAATGFSQGLGGQGTLVGVQLLSQVNVTSLIDGFVNGQNGSSAPGVAAAPSNGTVVMRRSVFRDSDFLPRDVVARQAQVGAIGTGNSFNLSLIINADNISKVTQTVIDTLTCEGIGGLMLIGLGLISSGTIEFNSLKSFNTTLIKQALPKGVMHFTSGGNIYQIDGTIIADNIDTSLTATANGIIINGNPVIKFGVFLALHIILALLAFILLLPLVLSLDATRNLLVRLQMSHVLRKIPRWMDIVWLFVMTPLALLALIFGALAGGSSGHFRTVHGILGLITIFVTLGASTVHFLTKMRKPVELSEGIVLPTKPFRLLDILTVRTAINQLLFALALPTVIAGFADLSSVTVCVTRIVPFEAVLGFAAGLLLPYSVAYALASLTIGLSMREVRAARKAAKGDEEDWGNKSLKEKIQVLKQQNQSKDGNKEMDMTTAEMSKFESAKD